MTSEEACNATVDAVNQLASVCRGQEAVDGLIAGLVRCLVAAMAGDMQSLDQHLKLTQGHRERAITAATDAIVEAFYDLDKQTDAGSFRREPYSEN